MKSKIKQGIIEYSEPEIYEGMYGRISKTDSGAYVYSGASDENIDRIFLGTDDFTVSYHGLVENYRDELAFFAPRLSPHIAISTELVRDYHSKNIIEGMYIDQRDKPDSLREVLGSSGVEHTLGYAVLTLYEQYDNGGPREALKNHEVGVLRSVGDAALRGVISDFVIEEIDREKGSFISSGELTENQLDRVLARTDIITAYATQDGEIDSVVVVADSPSVFPWFNEKRIEVLAGNMNHKYEDVHLAFLAFTNPKKRDKHVASNLFGLAIEEVAGEKNSMILCTECSPRSISYVPFMMAKRLSGKWDLKDLVIERTKAVVYPKDTL